MGLTHWNGVCVTGSGLYRGEKNSEVPIFPAGNGIVDAGTTGFSGSVSAISTRLSTITAVYAQEKRSTFTSGRGGVWVDWSGHAFDAARYYVNTSTNSSAPAASGVIGWIAVGY
jgi:hypothetical protein